MKKKMEEKELSEVFKKYKQTLRTILSLVKKLEDSTKKKEFRKKKKESK